MKTISALAVAMLLGSCGESGMDTVQFSGSPRIENPSTPKSEDAVAEKPKQVAEEIIEVSDTESVEFFLTEKIQQDIDLVWVFDNSGSMDDEYEIVRSNFAAFFDNVAEDSNLNMAVLSGESFDGVDLASRNVKHVEAKVGSFSSLKFLSAALCEEGLSEKGGGLFSDDTICGEKVDSSSLEIGDLDDAKGVTDRNFLKLMKYHKVSSDIEFYGFIGKDGSRLCDIARRGKSYENIAKKSGGKTYDICDDWTRHFDDLTESVLKVRNRPLKLAKTPKTIKWVKVGGRYLKDHQWILYNDTVVLKGVKLEEDDDEISVKYTWSD